MTLPKSKRGNWESMKKSKQNYFLGIWAIFFISFFSLSNSSSAATLPTEDLVTFAEKSVGLGELEIYDVQDQIIPDDAFYLITNSDADHFQSSVILEIVLRNYGTSAIEFTGYDFIKIEGGGSFSLDGFFGPLAADDERVISIVYDTNNSAGEYEGLVKIATDETANPEYEFRVGGNITTSTNLNDLTDPDAYLDFTSKTKDTPMTCATISNGDGPSGKGGGPASMVMGFFLIYLMAFFRRVW